MPLFRKGPDEDDLMVLVRGDGNILFDDKVRQELGLLHSDRFGQSLLRVEQAQRREWPRRNDVSVKTGAAFVYDADPPPPSHSAEIMNYILPESYRAALVGNSYRQRKKRRQMHMIKAAVGTIVVLMLFTAFVVIPIMQQAAINAWAGRDGGAPVQTTDGVQQ